MKLGDLFKDLQVSIRMVTTINYGLYRYKKLIVNMQIVLK